MNDKNFIHFILTRFNVPDKNMSTDKGGKSVLTKEWMNHRMELFEKYCFPTVRSQQNKGFKWLVFFDSNTDKEYLERIEEYKKLEQFEPIFVPEMNHCKGEVRKRIPSDSKYLITTRLDNDDALEKNMIEVVQSNFNEQKFTFLNCTQGFYFSGEKIYFVKDYSNPFVSLVESIGDDKEAVKTVWCASHVEVSKFGKVVQIDDQPRWLRIIHERNAGDRDPAKVGALIRFVKPIVKKLMKKSGLSRGAVIEEGFEKVTSMSLKDIMGNFSLVE